MIKYVYTEEVLRTVKKIKNANNKTVCTADAEKKTVEIVHKGFKTVIRFMPDGTIKIVNTSAA